MFNLIKKIRELNLVNKNIDIFTFDHQTSERDKLMASTFKANVDPTKVTLALTGNIHSMTEHGRPWNKAEENMGAFIKEKFKNTHSIYFSYSGGSGWACMPNCGVHSFGEEKSDVILKFTKSDGSNNHMWNWEIGNVKASLPAKHVMKTSIKLLN